VSLMSHAEFEDFFEPYAGNVEGFYEVAYWRFADEVIRELIRRHMPLSAGATVVDAGGGTGRWGLWLADEFGVHVTVADKSDRMLKQAIVNRTAAGVDDRGLSVLQCDLQEEGALPSAAFDAALSTYGVLSFLDDPRAAFATIAMSMRPGAVGLLMSHSYSNALGSKLNRSGVMVEELRELAETRIVRWSPGVPPLRVYSADDLRDLAHGAGLVAEAVFGVTSLVQPGPQDFGYPYDQISDTSRRLEDPEYFSTALQLELAASERANCEERGTNLMVKVRKPH
jgi:SAM-dependent methyltransferase